MTAPDPLPADIVAALVAAYATPEPDPRARAAASLGWSLRTLNRRIRGHADELARLADEHHWPARGEPGTRAAAAAADAARPWHLENPEDDARRAKNAARMRRHRAKARPAPTQDAR